MRSNGADTLCRHSAESLAQESQPQQFDNETRQTARRWRDGTGRALQLDPTARQWSGRPMFVRTSVYT
jgi:hypothetical protein